MNQYLTIDKKKKIAALAYEGYSIERINEHTDVPIHIIEDFIKNTKGYNL